MSDPAFPSHEASNTDPRNQISGGGLTKREYAAIAAMQGLLAGTKNVPGKTEEDTAKDYGELSVKLADALLAALEKKA